MTTNNPTPSQLLAALLDEGVDVQTYKGWDTVGRPWKGPDGSPGMTGVVVHHTATPTATGTSGAPSLWWAVNAYDRPICNLLVGRGPGDTYLLSSGSAYHCGKGGPIPELGIWSHGFQGQTRLFGIEIEDPGLSPSSLTDYQIEQVGKVLAALHRLTGFNIEEGVLTHKCYTDGCHTKAKSPLPSIGRKNDTIDGAWRQFPGDKDPKPYNAPFWREQAAQRLDGPAETWDGTVPSLRSARRAFRSLDTDEPLLNWASWRVACRLYDLGIRKKPAREPGKQGYPRRDVKRFRRSLGWSAGTGYPSDRTWVRLWGKVK